MMYHLSSLLKNEKLKLSPETKHGLEYKYALYNVLSNDFEKFCELYSSNDYVEKIEDLLGWRKGKLFCECIFEYVRRKYRDKNLFSRIESFYLSKSLDDINEFKQYSNRTGITFEVNVDVSSCQKYDMNIFTLAETYLAKHDEITKDVFDACCNYAEQYWNEETTDNPRYEYLYYGNISLKPIKQK